MSPTQPLVMVQHILSELDPLASIQHANYDEEHCENGIMFMPQHLGPTIFMSPGNRSAGYVNDQPLQGPKLKTERHTSDMQLQEADSDGFSMSRATTPDTPTIPMAPFLRPPHNFAILLDYWWHAAFKGLLFGFLALLLAGLVFLYNAPALIPWFSHLLRLLTKVVAFTSMILEACLEITGFLLGRAAATLGKGFQRGYNID